MDKHKLNANDKKLENNGNSGKNMYLNFTIKSSIFDEINY